MFENVCLTNKHYHEMEIVGCRFGDVNTQVVNQYLMSSDNMLEFHIDICQFNYI